MDEQGAIKHRIELLERRVYHIERQLTPMDERISEIHEILTRAGGGWRVLVAIGAIITGIAVVVNAVSALGNYLRH